MTEKQTGSEMQHIHGGNGLYPETWKKSYLLNRWEWEHMWDYNKIRSHCLVLFDQQSKTQRYSLYDDVDGELLLPFNDIYPH